MKRALVAVTLVAIGGCGGGRAVPAKPVVQPLGAPKVVTGALAISPLLGDLPSRASRAGAGALAVVASGPMVEGERLGAFVEIPKDACLLAYARSAPSLEDIDVAAFTDEGTPVAVDERPDPKPTVMVCPPHPDRVYVAAHAASGEGLCVIAAQLVPRERATEVANASGARYAQGGGARSPEAWPGLDDRVRAHRATLGGAWDEVRRVALSVDARSVTGLPISIDAGACLDALLVPDEDVAIVDGEALDGEGRLVGRARDVQAGRGVTLCSPIAFSGTLQVRPHVGRGLVAVVLSKLKPEEAKALRTKADVAWIAPTLPLDKAREERNAALAKNGYPAPSSTKSGQLVFGARATVPVELRGECARIDVVAGAPLAVVEADLWSDAGNLLGGGEGTDGATVFGCGRGKARLDLATHGRPGPYSILVRPEKWKDPIFLVHPLASGRMLERATSGPHDLFEGSAVEVRAAALESARQYVHNASIPPNQCLRVAVGVEGQGTGVEARLFDAVDGDELDRAQAQSSALVRACAGAATRSVRLELRASAGKLEAVIGTRLLGAR